MLLNEIPVAIPRKPQVAIPQRPRPVKHGLERQPLNKQTNISRILSREITKIPQPLVDAAGSKGNKRTRSDCSNKHIADDHLLTNQSSSVPGNQSGKPRQQNYVNTNLITEATTALITKTSEQPHVSDGFCDRLTITFGDPSLDTESFSLAIHDLSKKTADSPYLVRTKLPKSAYAWSFWIKSSKGTKLALLQLNGKSANMRFARLDFNPAAIRANGVGAVRQLIAMLFGNDYRTLIESGRITRLDASLDVYGQHVSDLIAYTVYPQQNTRLMRNFSKDGEETWILGTQYIGSKNSGRRFSLYDKERQLFEVKGIRPTQAHTRIELKYRADRCGCSADAKNVLNVANPLLPLKFAFFPCQQSIEPSLEFFLLGVREWGLNPALSKIADKNKRCSLRRVIGKQSISWWQPDRIWKDVLQHIHSLDLFPQSSFSK